MNRNRNTGHKYRDESVRVIQAYNSGTEMGHCAYIAYLEKRLEDAENSVTAKQRMRLLEEIRELKRKLMEVQAKRIRELSEVIASQQAQIIGLLSELVEKD